MDYLLLFLFIILIIYILYSLDFNRKNKILDKYLIKFAMAKDVEEIDETLIDLELYVNKNKLFYTELQFKVNYIKRVAEGYRRIKKYYKQN